MLKKKPKVEPKKEEPKVVEKVIASPIDLTPMLSQLEKVVQELNKLNGSIPATLEKLSSTLEALDKKDVPTIETKDINSSLFDIQQVLSKFVKAQEALTKSITTLKEKPKDIPKDKTEEELLRKISEGVNKMNIPILPKKPKDWEFKVYRDNSGIYKVTATENI